MKDNVGMTTGNSGLFSESVLVRYRSIWSDYMSKVYSKSKVRDSYHRVLISSSPYLFSYWCVLAILSTLKQPLGTAPQGAGTIMSILIP